MRRNLLIAIIVIIALIIGLIWLSHVRDGTRQVHATFARLQQEVEGGDASGVVGELAPDYDYTGLWPGYFDNAEIKTALGDGNPDAKNRDVAKHGLAILFFTHRERPYHFAYTVKNISFAPDGTATVDCILEVGDGTNMVVDPQVPHTFVLVPSGIFATMRIRSHDKFTAAIGM